MTRDISNSDDVIDSRDVIARIEELEGERDVLADTLCEAKDDTASYAADVTLADHALREWDISAEASELKSLLKFMDEMKGQGGDEQWRGDWYPVTIIRDSYFEDYAQELAEECCPYPRNSPEMKALEQWPYRCIDWKQAARELQMDYTSVDFDGVTYWVRQ